MNNLDDYGCTGGMRRKTPGAPHGPAMGQTAGEKGAGAVGLQPVIPKSDRLLGTGNAAARPPTRPERSGYSFTAP